MTKATQKLLVRNLADDIFDRVQHDVLTGALPPDQAIRQDALAEKLGVSIIPIREALGRLEQLGIIVSYPRRGYMVRPLSATEAEEIFDLRLALEPKAGAAGARAAVDEDKRMALDALLELETNVRQGAAYAGALNRQFHRCLLAPAARPLTLDTVMRLHVMAERYVNLHLQPEGRADRAEYEHRTILKAWCDGDAPRVKTLLAEHIQETFADLRVQISNSKA